jgi:hypothetical protein
MRIYAVGLTVTLLAGCVHRLSSDLERWVGQPEAALISEKGAPNRSAEIDGGRVLTYVLARDGATGQECVANFTVTKGVIAAWSQRGCPKVVTGR